MAPPTVEIMRQNALLNGLEETMLTRILPQCQLVTLTIRQVIYEPEQMITLVYFPIRCVLSVVSTMEDGMQIEIGTIGREGMSAFPLLMGASATANDCYCQVHGTAVLMSADLFRELSATNPDLRQQLDRYLQAYVNMLGQLAACNRLHSVIERCARWLLMTHDRVNREDIHLTHEYLAMMLGTNRSGVTIASKTLHNAGLIKYVRGVVTVIDRPGLENAACECYKLARTQFDGLLRRIETVESTGTRSGDRAEKIRRTSPKP